MADYQILSMPPGYFVVYWDDVNGYITMPILVVQARSSGGTPILYAMNREGSIAEVSHFENVKTIVYPGETLDDALIAVGIIPPDRD